MCTQRFRVQANRGHGCGFHVIHERHEGKYGLRGWIGWKLPYVYCNFAKYASAPNSVETNNELLVERLM